MTTLIFKLTYDQKPEKFFYMALNIENTDTWVWKAVASAANSLQQNCVNLNWASFAKNTAAINVSIKAVCFG